MPEAFEPRCPGAGIPGDAPPAAQSQNPRWSLINHGRLAGTTQATARTRTIVVTTHQVEEIEHVLTDLMFMDRGRIVLQCSMEELEARYLEVMVRPEQLDAARALKPMRERQGLGRSILLFQGMDRERLSGLGEVRNPSVADLFVAVIGSQTGQAQGAA